MNEQAKINMLREVYPAGTRVQLIEMDDQHAPPVGMCGTVILVDDMGTIHIKWDNGSTLGVVFGIDKVVKIGEGVSE